MECFTEKISEEFYEEGNIKRNNIIYYYSVDQEEIENTYSYFAENFGNTVTIYTLYRLEEMGLLYIINGSKFHNIPAKVYITNPLVKTRRSYSLEDLLGIKIIGSDRSFAKMLYERYKTIIYRDKPNIKKDFKEKDLENILIKDLSVIEDGLELIDNQYEIDNGFIDILARDKNGKLCIIELKIKSDDKRLVYQSVYYPTQFNEDIRMITIAPDYTDNIINSLQSLGYVEMKRYFFNNLAKRRGKWVKTNNDDPIIYIHNYDEKK